MLDLSHMKSCVFLIKVVTLNKDLCVAPESIAWSQEYVDASSTEWHFSSLNTTR